MSINANLNELLVQLPDLLSWIAPGLLFIFAFRCFKYEERGNEKESISILRAICISFIARYVVIIIFSRFWNLSNSVWIAMGACGIAILFGILIGMVSNFSAVRRFSEKYLHFTIDNNPFSDLADKKVGCNVRVYLKDDKEEYVYGIYSNCYNRGSEDWIAIKSAIKLKERLIVMLKINMLSKAKRQRNY